MKDKKLCYRAAMSAAWDMLKNGIISEKEYDKIDRIMANKYGLDSCTILCRKPLINSTFRANMSPNKAGGASNE